MKRIVSLSLVAMFIVTSTGPAGAEPPPAVVPAATDMAPGMKHVQLTCPVMGGPIDKSVYVEQNGLRIYACCPGCIPEIKKDFTKIAAKLEAQGIDIQKVQTTCPIETKEEINKKLYVDHNGKRIYVCCGNCLPIVKKDPAKYIEQLEKQGITLDTVPVKK